LSATDRGSTWLATYERCKLEFKRRYIQRIVPHGQVSTPRAFGDGIVLHAMRATWFEGGFDTSAKTWVAMEEAVRKELESQRLPITKESLAAGRAMMEAYVKHYERLPKPEVLLVEHPTQADHEIHMTERVDDLSRYPEAGRALCIGELKTTSSTPAQVHEHYKLAFQPLHYLVTYALSPLAKQHGLPSGVLFDVVQKPNSRKDKPTFGRFFVAIPERVQKMFLRSLEGEKPHEMKWDDYAKPNFTACSRVIPGVDRFVSFCPYRDLCLHGRSAVGGYMFSDGSSLQSWKPTKGKETPPWES